MWSLEGKGDWFGLRFEVALAIRKSKSDQIIWFMDRFDLSFS